MTIYAIGDIHGDLAQLDTALERIAADGGSDAKLVVLGDLVDRGADSRGVIDTLLQGIGAGRDWTVIRGNHDRMFLNFLETGVVDDANIKSGVPWTHQRLGGPATLASYGVVFDDRPLADIQAEAAQAVPPAHLEFLHTQPLHHQAGELLFVHAGIRPGVALSDQVENDLIWIRDGFLDDARRHPWLVVHGHTALDAPAHMGNRVNLDSGAGYGRPLTTAVFEDGAVWTLGPNGRVPLTP